MIHLKIQGMNCRNCVAHVQEALSAVPGCESAVVNLETGRATVVGTASAEALVEAVEAEGYAAHVMAD